MCQLERSSGAPPRDVTEFRLRSAESGKPPSGFARDERLQSGVKQRRFLFDAGKIPCSFEQPVIDDQSRSHMYQYALTMHT